MTQADRLTEAAGVPAYTLMQRAGSAVANAAAAMVGKGRVLVLAGPGNNGGDGFVAAAELLKRGCDVRVGLLGPRDALTGSAAVAAEAYDGALEELSPVIDLGADLIIDALFGAGLSRDLDEQTCPIVERVNAAGVPVLAVDLPSGIDGADGTIRGNAIRATRTVTFFRLKPGHLLLPGRLHCGDTEVAQIGIEDSVLAAIAPKTFHNVPALWRSHLKGPALQDHKYSRGHVFVVSGPAHSTGAARLAAAGALRSGAGAVTVACPPGALLVNAAQLTAIMVRVFNSPEALAELLFERSPVAAIIGPGNGVGPSTCANVEAALATEAAVVLDADVFTSFADEPERLLKAIGAREAATVLTPHTGEFKRVFEDLPSKLEASRTAARNSGAIVVFKGADTVIAAPDGRAAINSNAPPDLATAGSGDVLAGIVGGLLTQQVPAFEAACAAVWIHGEAAASFGRGLIAEDLPRLIPGVLQRLDAGEA